MANLDPQVQIKLIDVSKEWAEKIADKKHTTKIPTVYPKEFDNVYKQLVKTTSGK